MEPKILGFAKVGNLIERIKAARGRGAGTSNDSDHPDTAFLGFLHRVRKKIEPHAIGVIGFGLNDSGVAPAHNVHGPFEAVMCFFRNNHCGWLIKVAAVPVRGHPLAHGEQCGKIFQY